MALVGNHRFYDLEVLASVINIFEQDNLLKPEYYSSDDRMYYDYNHDDIISFATGDVLPFDLQIRRKKRIKYNSIIKLDDRPGINIDFGQNIASKDLAYSFAFANRLAETYRPDFGWMHLFSGNQPPFEDELARNIYRIDIGMSGIAPRYDRYGPGGLGLRTFIGPRYVEIFGRELLLSTPAHIKELSWGGICIDLVPNPWQATPEDIIPVWQQSMEHLRSAQVFTHIELNDVGAVSFEVNKHPLSRRTL